MCEYESTNKCRVLSEASLALSKLGTSGANPHHALENLAKNVEPKNTRSNPDMMRQKLKTPGTPSVFASFPETSRYEYMQTLGRGGMGTVYLAEDRLTGARIALKTMLNPTAARLLRFKQEFRTVVELHHPNLVQLLELQKDASQWFFTMEYVDGQNPLKLLLGRNPDDPSTDVLGHPTLEVDDVTSMAFKEDRNMLEAPVFIPATSCDLDAFQSVISQLLSALAFLHDHGIVHRDLKPSNVLIDLHGQVKLLDFGIASQQMVGNHELQIGNSPVGTLVYMAPELFEGGEPTPAVDLYALGCMMFQFLTGDVPFVGNFTQISQAKQRRVLPRVDALVKDVPPEIVEICAALMSTKPEDRPSITEVQTVLGQRFPPLSKRSEVTPSLEQQGVFVGRQAEFERLCERLNQALAGHAQFVMISGESGMGKSTLASHFIAHAKRCGVLCFAGRCYEREFLPFVAWDRLMDQITLALLRWPRLLLEPMLEAIEAVEEIFPTVGILLNEDHKRVAHELSFPERLARAFEQFCDLLKYAQAQVPLLLVLDDLQWTDLESLALLEKVLDNFQGRILILGLSRIEGVDGLHPLRTFLERADSSGNEGHMILKPMQREACLALLAEMIQEPHRNIDFDAVLEQTKGSPLLILQLVDYLRGLDDQERSTYLQTKIDASKVIKGLLQRLSGSAEELLATLAIVGSPIPTKILQNLLDVSPELLDRLLAKLRSARMIKSLQQGIHGESQRFGQEIDVYHDQIREVLYHTLPATFRVDLHRRCAQVLEREVGHSGRYAEVLKRHWGIVGHIEKCREYTKKAADYAAAKFAFRKAAVLLEESFVLPGGTETYQEQAECWERIGEYYEWVSANDAAIRACQRALDLWKYLPNDSEEKRRCAELRLIGCLVRNHMAMGHFREGLHAIRTGFSWTGVQLERHVFNFVGVTLQLFGKLLLTTIHPSRFRSSSPTLWERTQLQFYVLVLPYLFLWPKYIPEAQLRYTLLSLRLGHRGAQFRSSLNKITVKLMFWRGISKRSVPKLRQALEQTEQDFQRDATIVGGQEILSAYRAILWLPNDLARARHESETAQKILAKRGLGDGLDANLTRFFLMEVIYLQGQFHDLIRFAEIERNRVNSHIPNRLWATTFSILALVRTGRKTEAMALLSQLEAYFAEEISNTFSLLLGVARSALALAQGDYHGALASRYTVGVGIIPRMSLAAANALWLEVLLEAVGCLLKQKDIQPRQLRTALLQAHLLTKYHCQPIQCLGYRALAVLYHHRGKKAAAMQAMKKALAVSGEVDGRYSRWLCLKTACTLGMGNDAMIVEANALEAQEGYVTFCSSTTNITTV